MYPRSEEQRAAGVPEWGYHYEEYGLVDGSHKVSRPEYDDGAAVIEGEIRDTAGRQELRIRYTTPYNFLIAPHGSPINNKDFDHTLERLLNDVLTTGEGLEDLAKEVLRLPRRLNG
jgi:hypothetical protein